MDLDTKTKRLSMLNFGFGDVTLPEPDNKIDKGDRRHLLGLYARQVTWRQADHDEFLQPPEPVAVPYQ